MMAEISPYLAQDENLDIQEVGQTLNITTQRNRLQNTS